MADLFGASRTIKAISLWQPWAALVAAGVKLHETRHWTTEHRGPIAIHAAKRIDVAGSPDALCRAALGVDWLAKLPTGCVVAVAKLTQVRAAADVADRTTRADLAAGNFAPGRFAWALNEVRPLAVPIPLCGRQGIFNWTPPDDIEERLLPTMDHEATCERIGWGRFRA